MLDDNNMVVIYTINSPEGNFMDVDSDLRVSLTGLEIWIFTFGGRAKPMKI
jgi:hypothetical protein